MGMTISEKILADCVGRDKVSPGDMIMANVDCCITNDLQGFAISRVFETFGKERVKDPDKIMISLDHQIPADRIGAANAQKRVREWAKRQGVHFYEVGKHGIMNIMGVEKGHARPGTLVVGTDSHTTSIGAIGAFATGIGTTEMAVAFATGKMWLTVPESIRIRLEGEAMKGVTGKDVVLRVIQDIGNSGALYKALEYTGSYVERTGLDFRFTICLMAPEMGAKASVMALNDEVLRYVKERSGSKAIKVFTSDSDAQYVDERVFDVSKIPPLVAVPPSPDNVKPVEEVQNVPVNQVYLGSCTNSGISDLRLAAEVLKGRTVHPDVRMLVFPRSQEVYLQADREGLLETFVSAGVCICNPTCGPCLGGHMGILADGEVCASCGNRNWPGRMGSTSSEVYLVSAPTAAASAVEGKIADPRRYLN